MVILDQHLSQYYVFSYERVIVEDEIVIVHVYIYI